MKITTITFINADNTCTTWPECVIFIKMPKIYNGSSGKITVCMVLTIISFKSTNASRSAVDFRCASPSPTVKAITSAVIMFNGSGMATVKNGSMPCASLICSIEIFLVIRCGNTTSPTPNDRNPDSTVATYASSVVATSILPAPLPMSAMAGVTRPTIIRGIINPRNWLNSPLNVTNKRTTTSGITNPVPIPSTIAMIIRGNSPILNFFITQFFCKDSAW